MPCPLLSLSASDGKLATVKLGNKGRWRTGMGTGGSGEWDLVAAYTSLSLPGADAADVV